MSKRKLEDTDTEEQPRKVPKFEESLSGLPDDALATVLSFMPLQYTLGVCTLVCQAWNQVIRSGVLMPLLGSIDFTGIKNVDDSFVQNFVKFFASEDDPDTLPESIQPRVVNLGGCFDINSSSIALLTKNSSRLTEANFSGCLLFGLKNNKTHNYFLYNRTAMNTDSTNVEDSTVFLPKMAYNLRNLEKLNISGCDYICTQLPQLISQCGPNLRELSICSTTPPADTLKTALQLLPKLQVLRISGAPFAYNQPHLWEEIVENAKQGALQELRVLDISNIYTMNQDPDFAKDINLFPNLEIILYYSFTRAGNFRVEQLSNTCKLVTGNPSDVPMKKTIDLTQGYFDVNGFYSASHYEGTPILMQEIHNQNINQVKELINAGANVNLSTKSKTALSVAIDHNNDTLFQYLIEQGATLKLTHRNENILPSLILHSAERLVKIVLQSKGIEKLIVQQDDNGFNALHAAISDRSNFYDTTPMKQQSPVQQRILQQLLPKLAPPTSIKNNVLYYQNKRGDDIFTCCAVYNAVNTWKSLEEASNGHINHLRLDSFGLTYLQVAANNYNEDLVKYLIDQKYFDHLTRSQPQFTWDSKHYCEKFPLSDAVRYVFPQSRAIADRKNRRAFIDADRGEQVLYEIECKRRKNGDPGEFPEDFQVLDLAYIDKNGRNRLHHACERRLNGNVIAFLLSNGVNPDQLDNNGVSCLQVLFERKINTSVVIPFLTFGANFNATYNGKTVLHQAVENMDAAAVQALLSTETAHPVDKNAVDSNGNTAFHLAVKGAFVDVLETLLINEVDTTVDFAQSNSGKTTALHYILKKYHDINYTHQHFDIMDLLFSYVPEMINAQDKDGKTPIHIAAEANNEKLVATLIGNEGVDLTIIDNNGKRCYEYVKGGINTIKDRVKVLPAQVKRIANKNIKPFEEKKGKKK
jgi:ankyrin repeat protein